MRYIHYLAGGGLGDVYREAYFHNALGILRRWKILHPEDHLKVLIMSHNPASADWLEGQDWIDELAVRRFPIEHTWRWEDAYELYPEDFRGHGELRFTIAETASLYRSDLSIRRPRPVESTQIAATGCANSIVLQPAEQELVRQYGYRRFVLHPFAGQKQRWIPEDEREWLLEYLGETTLTLGGDYERPDHDAEVGCVSFKPRVWAEILKFAAGVVAAESSVYYVASMLGIPVVMLYAADQTYDLVKRGKSNWAWYFGEADPRNLFLKMPLTDADRARLVEWMEARRHDG